MARIDPTSRRPTRPSSRRRRADRGRSCATRAMRWRGWPPQRASSRPTTTFPTSRTLPWSHRPQRPASPTDAAKRGRAPRTRKGRATSSPRALGIPVDRVKVNVTLLSGGFGRKSKPDYVVEAALLSRAVGAPVQVTWTREDEIHHDYYHTVTAQHLEAG